MNEQQTEESPAPEAVKAPKVHPTKDTQREYETIYLLTQDLVTEQTDKIKERIRGVIEREGGRVIKFTTWGRKKTAFLVGDKQTRAIYVHVNYLAQGGVVAEVERNLRNIEDVLKFQTIKLSDAVLPESRPTEEDVVLEGDRDEERPAREAEKPEEAKASEAKAGDASKSDDAAKGAEAEKSEGAAEGEAAAKADEAPKGAEAEKADADEAEAATKSDEESKEKAE